MFVMINLKKKRHQDIIFSCCIISDEYQTKNPKDFLKVKIINVNDIYYGRTFFFLKNPSMNVKVPSQGEKCKEFSNTLCGKLGF